MRRKDEKEVFLNSIATETGIIWKDEFKKRGQRWIRDQGQRGSRMMSEGAEGQSNRSENAKQNV